MTKGKNTKRALLMSIVSVMLCFAMLVSSTFAWFTDNVSSGKNQIVAGNLDVELEYRDAAGAWKEVTQDTKLFSAMEADGKTENLWEPGHTEVVYLKISNAGSLALKYQFAVTVSRETTFENVLGEKDCKLSDYLVFGQAESKEEIAKYATREAAWEAAGDELGLEDFTKSNELLEPQEAEYVALIVYMPTTVGNEANYRGNVVPSIDLGVTLVATQTPFEEDSFGKNYDEFAYYPNPLPTVDLEETVVITPENGAVVQVEEGFSIRIQPESVSEETAAIFSMKTTESTTNSTTFEISLKEPGGNDITLEKPAVIQAEIGKHLENVKVTHSDVPMTEGTSSDALQDQEFFYDAEKGVLYLCTATFSPFKVEYAFAGLPISAVAIKPAEDTTGKVFYPGDTLQLQLEIDPKDKTNISSVKWSAKSTSCIRVDQNGLVTYLTKASLDTSTMLDVVATVTDGAGNEHSATFKVPNAKKTFQISVSSTSFKVGESKQATLDLDGAEGIEDLQWSSSDASKFFLDEKSGMVTALKNNRSSSTSCTITAKFTRNGVPFELKKTVTSNPGIPEVATVFYSTALTVGSTMQLSEPIGLSALGNVHWSSSNEACITVDENGLLTVVGSSLDDKGIYQSTFITASMEKDGHVYEATVGFRSGKKTVEVVDADGVVKSYISPAEALTNSSKKFTMTLTDDVTISNSSETLYLGSAKDVILDLNGHTITALCPSSSTRLAVVTVAAANATLTVNGEEEGSGIKIGGISNLYTFNVLKGAELYINGGTYAGAVTVVQVQEGTAYILDGSFSLSITNPEFGSKYLLNCVDQYYKTDKARIWVRGGSFEGFNPADNEAEGAGTSFIEDAGTYEVTEEDGWYTVALTVDEGDFDDMFD